MDEHTTTVVVSRDGWSRLAESLPQHRGQVILVDNGSRDGTVQRVGRQHPEVAVVELGRNIGAAARNIGVARARTPYVAFADDDSWWQPGALSHAAELFEQYPRLALITGQVLVGAAETPDPICAELAAAPLGQATDLPGPDVLGFLACGAIVRRAAFLRAGGFDEVVFFFGEEERLALDLAAAGWGLAYVPEVIAHHYPQPTGRRPSRISLASRNRVLTATMRRPPSVVLATVLAEWSTGRHQRRGVLDAIPRLPAAVRARARLPRWLEDARGSLDRVNFSAEPDASATTTPSCSGSESARG